MVAKKSVRPKWVDLCSPGRLLRHDHIGQVRCIRRCQGSVGSLKRLHPTIDLHPNHHATFHIYNYLLLFGSVQSWWTFPFECLIGVLQCLPSNHKSGALFHRDGTYTLTRILGELEVMMLQSYLKGAKLQTWLSCPDCPSTIRECKYSSIELTRHPMPTKMMTVSFQVIFQSRPLYPRICSCLWDSARWHYVLISSTLLVFITAIPRPMLATHSSCSIHLAISSFYWFRGALSIFRSQTVLGSLQFKSSECYSLLYPIHLQLFLISRWSYTLLISRKSWKVYKLPGWQAIMHDGLC